MLGMALNSFHPVVQDWFRSKFEAPSPPQEAGWPKIASGKDTLICAPTGTGKTLTAFMAGIDTLFRRALGGQLEEKTYILYVSPLKALSNDIQKNLKEPLDGIFAEVHARGLIAPEIRSCPDPKDRRLQSASPTERGSSVRPISSPPEELATQ